MGGHSTVWVFLLAKAGSSRDRRKHLRRPESNQGKKIKVALLGPPQMGKLLRGEQRLPWKLGRAGVGLADTASKKGLEGEGREVLDLNVGRG